MWQAVAVEPSLLYLIKQVELAVRSHLDELLRPHDLTTATYTALTVLARRAGRTTADLARTSFVTPQAMADIVTALEHRGLVTRRGDPAHGRRRLIDLTAGGHAVLARVAPDVAALEDRMVTALAPDERQTLRSALDGCRAALTR